MPTGLAVATAAAGRLVARRGGGETSLSCCCCSCSVFSRVCGFPADTDLFILFMGVAGTTASVVVFKAAGTEGAASVFMGPDVEAVGLGASPTTSVSASKPARFSSLFTCCWVRISASPPEWLLPASDSRPESSPPSVTAARDEVAAAAVLGFALGFLPFLLPAIADRSTRWCELPPPMTAVRFTRAILLTLLGGSA